MMVKLVQRMKEAAELDFDANEVKRPSIAKLKMLPAVLVHLNKWVLKLRVQCLLLPWSLTPIRGCRWISKKVFFSLPLTTDG